MKLTDKDPAAFEHLLQKLCSIFSENEVEQLGRKAGFSQRRSKIKAADFLKLTLFDLFCFDRPSLLQHASSIHKDNGKTVSRQAIDKRFGDKGILLLQHVLEQLLNRRLVPERLPSDLYGHFRSVRILDSTRLTLPSCFRTGLSPDIRGKAGITLQFEYDILQKRIECLSHECAPCSDKAFADRQMYTVQKGDLLLRDLGYYSIDTYSRIEQQGAFYVSRIRPQVRIFRKTKDHYKAIRMADIVQTLKCGGAPCFDQWVYIGEKQKHPVRMIAWLPVMEAPGKGRSQNSSHQGNAPGRELNIVISNVPGSMMDAPQICDLYKVRWQIELIFKAWKRLLHMDKLGKMKVSRLKCYLIGKLIWIVIGWDIAALAEPVLWQREKKLLSLYKATAALKASFVELKQLLFFGKALMEGWLRSALAAISRYCRKEHRKNRPEMEQLLSLQPRPPGPSR